MKKILLKIEGMTCSACSNGLEKYLNKQEGIENASVNLVMANALIEYDEQKLEIKQIENFIKKAGLDGFSDAVCTASGSYMNIDISNKIKNPISADVVDALMREFLYEDKSSTEEHLTVTQFKVQAEQERLAGLKAAQAIAEAEIGDLEDQKKAAHGSIYRPICRSQCQYDQKS